jgi:hypothetical protein
MWFHMTKMENWVILSSKMGDIKFNDGWGVNIELKFPELLPKLLVKRASKKQKWSECLTSLTSFFQTLCQKCDFMNSEMDILQKQMDKWTRDCI